LLAKLNQCQIPRNGGLRNSTRDGTGWRLLRHVAVVRSLIEISGAEYRSLRSDLLAHPAAFRTKCGWLLFFRLRKPE
jgi:hypothetical protein